MLKTGSIGRTHGPAVWVMTAALSIAPGAIALAQTGTTPPQQPSTGAPSAAPSGAVRPAAKGQPVRRGRVMKPAIVNLEAQAVARREGQVLPGDPPPEKFAPPAPSAPAAPPAAPAPVTSAPATTPAPTPSRETELPLESSAPPPPPPVASPTPTPTTNPSRPLKPAPTPVDPESGPRPLPRMPEMSQAAPAEPDAAAEVAETVEDAAAAMNEGVTMEPASATASVETPGAPTVGRARSEPVTPPVTPVVAPEPDAPRLEWLGAEVTVESASGRDVQWRTGDGAWNIPASGARESGRIEIRTGPEGEALVNVDGQVAVRVAPLSRIVIERRAGLKLMPSVLLERGAVDLRAQSSEPVETWVRTPDRRAGFATWPGVRISYNAFSGTSVQTGAEIAQPR